MSPGPREAGVLLGQARAREAARKSVREDDVLALERIASALEGLEVSMAVLADIVEAQAYGPEPEEYDLSEDDVAGMGCA